MSEPSRRFVFIDLLRLVASVQMVQGHTIDALLDDGLRTGAGFELWSWARGLTSVGFLFAAGLSYYASTLARFERHRSDPRNGWRRVRRALVLIGLGYALHLPIGALGDASAWAGFAIVDVLQCIGVSLLMLEAMTWLARSPAQVAIAAGSVGAVLVVIAPFADRVDPTGSTRLLASYLTHRGGSLFPLAPWAGFMLAGAAVGAIVMRGDARTLAIRSAWLTLALFAIAIPARLGSLTWLAPGDSTSSEPAPALVKLAAVLAVTTLLALATARVRRLPATLRILAGETLALYVSHLLVLYGSGVGLVVLVGHRFGLASAIVAAIAAIVLSAVVVLAWHRAKAAWAARGAGVSARVDRA